MRFSSSSCSTAARSSAFAQPSADTWTALTGLLGSRGTRRTADHTGGGVAGGVPRDDLDRLGRRGREVELEAPVLPDGDHALARDDVRRSPGEPVQHEGRAHLPPEDVAGKLQRRRGAVDRDEPGGAGGGPWQGASDESLDPVLAVGKGPRCEQRAPAGDAAPGR